MSFYQESFSNSKSATNSSVNQIAHDLLQMSTKLNTVSQITESVVGNGVSARYTSEIEAAILRSTSPININESEEITVLGHRGIWANKAEVVNWKGALPIEQYQINEDSNPELITKRVKQQLEYVQELAIRYLRPPTPPPPGEIFIAQEGNTMTPPAPPLVIRQQPARAPTPEPLVIRETPPQPPQPLGRKLITISGKRLPPPPRKVIIERLAALPSKPQSVIIERWLPYAHAKRRVIFQKLNNPEPVVVKPRNVIVQWEAPQVVIKKDYKYLGVVRANPVEYVARFGASLKSIREMPQFVLDIKTPDGLVLAAEHKNNLVYELEGDVQALKLIDLDKEGLGEYKAYLQRVDSGVNSSNGLNALEEIFRNVNVIQNGKVNGDEVEKLLVKFSSRFGKQESEVRAFFETIEAGAENLFDLEELKRAFLTNFL